MKKCLYINDINKIIYKNIDAQSIVLIYITLTIK